MHQHSSTLVSVVIVVIVLALRMRGLRRARRLRLELLWVVPALLLAAAIATFIHTPPMGLGWLWVALAIAVGAGVGWWRGAMMRITIDPTTHLLNQQASPAALITLFAIIAIRYAARFWLADAGPGLAIITDCLLASALGMFTLQRLEMFLRARRLLAAPN